MISRVDSYLSDRTKKVSWLLAAVVFVLLCVVLRSAIHQIPVWDGAMSVYPAAIELSLTGFDLPRLLDAPGYLEGGPNTHALSPWTFLVALVIAGAGSLPGALPALHILTFAIAAILIAGCHRLISTVTPGLVAVIGSFAILAFPPMLVQASDIYLDLPLAALAIWGTYFMVKRRNALASLSILGATLVKQLGVIFAVVLAAHILLESRAGGRLMRAFWAAGPSFAATIALALVQRPGTFDDPVAVRYDKVLRSTAILLESMPEVLVMLLLLLFCGCVSIPRATSDAPNVLRPALLLVGAVPGFLAIDPLLTQGFQLLPRYYIAWVPVIIAGVLTEMGRRSTIVASSIASVALLLFTLNITGRFYPLMDQPYFPLAERSLAYRDLLKLHTEDFQLIEELADRMPVLYDHFGHFRASYPSLGYAEAPLPGGRSPSLEDSLKEVSLDDLPEHFALLIEYPVLGGETLVQIWDEARASPEVTVTEHRFTQGSFTVYVVEVHSNSAG